MQVRPPFVKRLTLFCLYTVVPAGIASIWGMKEALMWLIAGGMVWLITETTRLHMMIWFWEGEQPIRMYILPLLIESILVALFRVLVGMLADAFLLV